MLETGKVYKIISRETFDMMFPNDLHVPFGLDPRMKMFLGRPVTVTKQVAEWRNGEFGYRIIEDHGAFTWGESLFEEANGKKKPTKTKFKKGAPVIKQRTGFVHGRAEYYNIINRQEGTFSVIINNKNGEDYKFCRIRNNKVALVFTESKINIFSSYLIKSVEKMKKKDGSFYLKFTIK